MVLLLLGPGIGNHLWGGRRPQQAAPRGRRENRSPLGYPSEAVTDAGGLTREDDAAAGSEDPVELGECAVKVRQVVQDGVAYHKVKARVWEGERFGVRGDRVNAP
jgi:hypothetical protein